MTRAGQFGDQTNLRAKSSVQGRGGVANPASGGGPGTARRFEGAIVQLGRRAVLAEHEEKSLGVAARHAPGNGAAAVRQIESDLLSDVMSWAGACGSGRVHAPLQALPAPARRAVGQRGRDDVGCRRAAYWCPAFWCHAFWCMGFCRRMHRSAVRGGRRGRDGAAPVVCAVFGLAFWCAGFCMPLHRAAMRGERRSRDDAAAVLGMVWCMRS
jgi:hypothetical protein